MKIVKGIVAGLVATLVFSALMVAAAIFGIAPELNLVAMLGRLFHTTPSPAWVIHFAIGGVLWGGGFAIAEGRLPGSSVTARAVVFSLLAWLAMMAIFMPVAGAGFFAASLGIATTATTLILEVVFGLVLGGVYRLLGGGRGRP